MTTTTKTTANKLMDTCDAIRDELERLYNGLDLTDDEREEMEENGEVIDLYSYFSDVLDINYILDYQKELRGVRVAVTLGGPNIWIDTVRGVVAGFWGSDHAESWIPSEICDEITDIFSELF